MIISSSEAIASGQLFLAKLILEVLGGAGAVWGFSEAIGWRTEATVAFWRPVGEMFGLLFALRWMWQIREHYDHHQNQQQTHSTTSPTITTTSSTPEPLKQASSSKEKNVRHFLCTFSVKLILEVMGATGAVWGFAETLHLRTRETQELWRLYALCTGSVFLVRYGCHAKEYLHEMTYGPPLTDQASSSKSIQFYHIFPARLILQVFGGGGAIWGFSELIGLRYAETQAFWRMNALMSAFCFGVRFVGEIYDHFDMEEKEAIATKQPVAIVVANAIHTLECVEAGNDSNIFPPPVQTPRPSIESYRKNYGTQSLTPETLEISVESDSFDYEDEEGFGRSPSDNDWETRIADVDDYRDPAAPVFGESFPYDERDYLLSPPRSEDHYHDERQDGFDSELGEGREDLDEREALSSSDEEHTARKLAFTVNQWSSSLHEPHYESSRNHKKFEDAPHDERTLVLSVL